MIIYTKYNCQMLLLLLLSRFSRVRLSATPETAAHQAPPSLGFSRQEHWSGLPFPSPMHESEKWKGSRWVVSDSSRPQGLQPTRLLHPWDFPGKSTGVGCHCLLRIISSVPDKVKAVYVFSSCIAKQIFTIVCWQCLSKFKEVNPLYSLCYIKNTNSITCHWRGLFYIIL